MKEAINQIIGLTAEEFEVAPNAIKGKSRCELFLLPRFAAMELIWRHHGFTQKTIGHYFGKRDHASVHHAIKRVRDLLQTNKAFRQAYENIESKIEL